ncbi:hemocyte protein-glutamine gamma-glutamyltransferase-like [Onthophagus taurus]|uniref:hemocyte protein-glutamine gamma-glutamyltransferase-like n=1 Tax=Onthophagus taurus TaxID=166361 RepID=UPI0039BE6B5D
MTDNLEVELVYLYPLENARRHKTDKYEVVNEQDPTPVFRRGYTFIMIIRFSNREYDESSDVVKLHFNYYGSAKNIMKGTKGVIPLKLKSDDLKDDTFNGKIIGQQENTITIEVCSPYTCAVGLWELQVVTSVQNSVDDPTVYNHPGQIYILFNPWHKSDLVYMPDERLLDEYILMDVGKIWIGPLGSCRGREWVFGQFDATVLPAAMLMLEMCQMPHYRRGDPISLCRIISKMVNNNDEDNGILVGRWDGDYIDGTAPSAWTGSVEILQQYLETQQSVSYGQCWVFSGVVTTICRALGIPSRVVSNLVSAHDANASLTIDKYFNMIDEELEYDPMNEIGEDSIWNYHVWNDVWMARPDLPKGYGGWQAIDATPQERSSHSQIYECGPASLEAIKYGVVGMNYDVGFMVASVNADLMRWKEDPKEELGFSKIYCNKHHIGRLILTKKPFLFDPNGDRDREDITEQYKPKEGTEAERLSLYNAVRSTRLAKNFYALPDPNLEDIEFDLVELDRIRIGEDFSVIVRMKNKCDEERNVRAVLSSTSVFYTGIKANLVKKAEGIFKLKPHSSERLELKIAGDEYIDKLVEYCNMKLCAVATVTETRQTWANEDDFQVVKPTITIKIPSEIPCKSPTRVLLQFINPLKKTLTNCKFNLSGPTLLRNHILSIADVEAGELVSAETEIVPKIAGEQKLIATFWSKELSDITGASKVEVTEEEE